MILQPSEHLSCAKMHIQAYVGTFLIESMLERGTKVTLTVKYHSAKSVSEEERRFVNREAIQMLLEEH